MASLKDKIPWSNLAISLTGLLVTAVSMPLFRSALLQWRSSNWFYHSLVVFSYSVGLCAGITLLLFPVRNYKIVGVFLQVIWSPLVLIIRIGRIYNFIAFPYIAFFAIVIFILVFWGIFSSLKIIPIIGDKVLFYLTFSLAFVLFTFWGRNITSFSINFIKPDVDKDKLYSVLHPLKVRMFVYGLMAVSYILANIEKFAAITIIPYAWWSTYKDVIVEILLTYVAVDSLFETWKDLKEEQLK